MAELNVLPSQCGKLLDDVEQTRYLGIEMEYHPGPVTMWDWRQHLYRVGIDTFDDGCQSRGRITAAALERDACGSALHATEFYRTPPSCDHARCTETPRAFHVQRCLGLTSAHQTANGNDNGEFYTIMGLTSAADRDAAARFLARQVDPAFYTRVERAFPRPSQRNSRLWNLGTDPTAGLELRMPPMSVSEHPFEAIERICGALEEGGAEANHSCGLHVHVDMRDKTSEERARLATTYLLTEPLILAAIAPHRYHNGYNQPLFGRASTSVPAPLGSMAQFSSHGNLLNFSALVEHGTVEWRQLEGTLNADTIKYWSLLALRVTEASKYKWGVKLGGVTPCAVTPDSVRSFMKFLDLNRKGLSDDLKNTRDWYMERVRQFGERSSFKRRLSTGNESLSLLRELKLRGYSTALKATVAYSPEPTATASPSEVGASFLRFINQLVATAGVQDPHGNGPLDWLCESDASVRIAEYASDYIHTTDEEGDVITRLTEEEWLAFARAIYNHDAEICGVWLKAHILDCDSRDDMLHALNNVLSYWMGYWSYNSVGMDTVSRLFQRNTGNNTCVDF